MVAVIVTATETSKRVGATTFRQESVYVQHD